MKSKGIVATSLIYSIFLLTTIYMVSKPITLIVNKGLERSVSNDIKDGLYDSKKRLKVNHPILVEGMTPIKFSGTSEIEIDENDSSWYDYGKKRWANAVTEDGSYWVWIPRYSYKIASCYQLNETECLNKTNKSAGDIEIMFLNGTSNKTFNDESVSLVPEYSGHEQMNFIKHTSFTFGAEEIEGFWIAKFQPSGTASNLSFKPNVVSLRTLKIGEMFDASYNMKDNSKYGWSNKNKPDTHMMKNVEWGGVAYLSQSIYGANDEVYKNNSSTFITGCSSDSVRSTPKLGCDNPYNTPKGAKASTTFNITGVYDMSSEVWESVPAYVFNKHDNSIYGENIIHAQKKYKEEYVLNGTDSESNNFNKNKHILGGAMYETSSEGSGNNSWYGNYSRHPRNQRVFLARGAEYHIDEPDSLEGGLFNYFYETGHLSGYKKTFRTVIIPKRIDEPNKPKLTDGMTPIKFNLYNEVETTENDPEWYDYNNAKWANAKTEDGSYWVWIPRYAYSIKNCYHMTGSECKTSTDHYAGEVDIKFLKNKTNNTFDETAVSSKPTYNGSKQTNYITHPAFKFGNKELDGFWVAKFQASWSNGPVGFKPNEPIFPTENGSVLPGYTISTLFNGALQFKSESRFGWNGTTIDTHMMKNIEWGAIAYLSESKYGSQDFTYANNSRMLLTGCVADKKGAISVNNCNILWDSLDGVKGSSTHNLYGVYEMAGGLFEYVSAYTVRPGGSSLPKASGSSLVTSYENNGPKYVDYYDSNGETIFNSKYYGDAMYEVSSIYVGGGAWYRGFSNTPGYSFWHFIRRGGSFQNGVNTGIFSFTHGAGTGTHGENATFRLVVIP